jgi:hypothetical protein
VDALARPLDDHRNEGPAVLSPAHDALGSGTRRQELRRRTIAFGVVQLDRIPRPCSRSRSRGTGRDTTVAVDASNAFGLNGPPGSPMLLTTYGERTSIPGGMRSGNDICTPTTDTVIPPVRSAAAADIPYAPGPRIAGSTTNCSSSRHLLGRTHADGDEGPVSGRPLRR